MTTLFVFIISIIYLGVLFIAVIPMVHSAMIWLISIPFIAVLVPIAAFCTRKQGREIENVRQMMENASSNEEQRSLRRKCEMLEKKRYKDMQIVAAAVLAIISIPIIVYYFTVVNSFQVL